MSAGVQLPLKWFGGKAYLADRIIALMPRHIHYVEPFAGGLAVLLNRDPNDASLWLPPHKGVSEVVNDLDRGLTNFWNVLKHEHLFRRFMRVMEATPLSRLEFSTADGLKVLGWEGVGNNDEGQVLRACAFFVRCRQSRAGGFKGFTSLTRNRLRRGINGNASEWLGAVDGLPEVHARLRPVVVENMDAVKLIQREDAPGTLVYADPPYLHETRATKDGYAHEMTESQHVELLDTLAVLKGNFILSGYDSELYGGYAAKYGWSRKAFDLPNNAAGGDSKRRMTEVLWFNF